MVLAQGDAGTFVGVTTLLSGSALCACLLVARKAIAIDPLVAMRSE
jgi:ABC-type lipoprotein release transport system permease subunit